MIIDAISDLHGHYPELEGGDLLIVAGDLTARDCISEYDKFFDWLALQEYKKKIYISGNHDGMIESGKYSTPKYCDATYLCDSGTEFEGLKIWGSPWTPIFPGINPKCTAFTGNEKLLDEKFALIPDDIDILVTHGPPFTILDMTKDGQQVGSAALLAHHIRRLNPTLFVWGHIHESHGIASAYSWNDTKYVNCSHVNEHYQPINKPIRIIL